MGWILIDDIKDDEKIHKGACVRFYNTTKGLEEQCCLPCGKDGHLDYIVTQVYDNTEYFQLTCLSEGEVGSITCVLLRNQLQDYDVDIQHVGSTSIVGCCAKPIIDIAMGVESLEYGEKLIPILCNIGYVYDGDGKIPGRHFLKKKDEKLSTHYIYVEPVNGMLWNNNILFREYLNKHPQVIIEYSKLKKKLEYDFFDNRDNYAIGKNPFIEKIIEIAESEKKMAE
jgi:GrpB-like predicted nucleotidyltransferase (UPF0157 family)